MSLPYAEVEGAQRRRIRDPVSVGKASTAQRAYKCVVIPMQSRTKAILTRVDAVSSKIVRERVALISAYHAPDMHVGVLGNASAHRLRIRKGYCCLSKT